MALLDQPAYELFDEQEEMTEEDRLPAGWPIYRANTECAMEAGHVNEAGPDGTLQPRLFIHRKNRPNLARQMRTYPWEKSSGKGVNISTAIAPGPTARRSVPAHQSPVRRARTSRR